MEPAGDGRSNWVHKISVAPDDIDHMGHVNNSVHLRWLQHAMEAHWERFAPESLFETFVWIALRHEIDYRRPILSGDHIRAVMRTDWIRGARACVEAILETQSGSGVIVRSIWVFIDAARNRPARIPESVARMFGASL
jgi:acyl-CoA thioester hydrolase